MSWANQIRKRTKTIQNDILTKTQIALEAIKNYEARQSLIYQKIKTNSAQYINPHNAIKQINADYSQLYQYKQVKIDKIYKIQIFPFNQQYYYINTQFFIFPVRIFVKNVKNQGIIYVGYDRELPGVDRHKKQDIYEPQKKNYDYKFQFNKDMLCVLRNQKRKLIKKIYITIVSQKQMLLCNLKFDYIGYQGMEQQQNMESKIRKRALTQGYINPNEKAMQLLMLSPIKKNKQSIFQNILLSKSSKSRDTLQNFKRSKTQDQYQVNNNSPTKRILYKNTTGTPQQPLKKNFIKKNLNQMGNKSRQFTKQQLIHKKQKKLQSLQKIKSNKQQLQQYKLKQKQIKQTASRLKKYIQNYQKLYKQQRIKEKRLIKLVAPLIYMGKYITKSNHYFNLANQSLQRKFKVGHVIKRFTKELKNKCTKNTYQIRSFKTRNQMNCFQMFQLTAKIVLPSCKLNGAKLVFAAFTDLYSPLMLNHSLNQATKFRQSVRQIQRSWLTKYNARLQMLENFAYRHIQSMLKQFPHLRMGFNTFKAEKHCHKICYEYMVDQSVKFRHIYDAYLKRLQQIQEFIKINYQVRDFNKGKPQNKWKKYIDIPKKPVTPQHRIFRNLDILKAMIRNWFELQYKKILKRSISGK